MVKEEITSTPRERTTSTATPQIECDYGGVFDEIIDAYCKFSDWLENNNDAPTGGGMINTAIADYIDDVESATDYALHGTDFLVEWFCYVEGYQIQPHMKKLLIELLGPMYRECGLAPDLYFVQKGKDVDYLRAVPWKARICESHGMQPVTHTFRDAHGYAMELECGCFNYPASEYDAAIAALAEAALLPVGNDVPMLGWFRAAA